MSPKGRVWRAMNIQVTLNNSGSHPVYNFQLLSRDGKHRVEKSLRFAPCREFHEDIVSSCDVVLEAPFPVTMKRSALGIKLTDDELEERRRQLAKVMFHFVLVMKKELNLYKVDFNLLIWRLNVLCVCVCFLGQFMFQMI